MTQEAVGNLFEKTAITVFGISHHELSAKDRQNFALSAESQKHLLETYKRDGISYAFVLSTCNRIEFFCLSNNEQSIKDRFLELVSGDAAFFLNHCYAYRGKEAVNHLFDLAAGTKSQIPGDFEIIGQLRKAFQLSKEVFDSSAFFERLMNTATQVSKRIKNETLFSSGVTSTAYAAVKSIRRKYSEIGDERLLIYGTGKIGKNVCENLVKHVPADRIDIINRSYDKAERLAKKYGLRCHPESELSRLAEQAKVIVVATGSDKPTLKADMLGQEQGKYIIDMSIPRNVSAEIYDSQEVIDVDELSLINDETLNQRMKELPRVKEIIEEDKTKFFQWMDQRKFAPTMSAIKDSLEALRNKELRKAPKDKELFNKEEVESLTDDILKKISSSLFTRIQSLDAKELNTVHQLFAANQK